MHVEQDIGKLACFVCILYHCIWDNVQLDVNMIYTGLTMPINIVWRCQSK